MSGKAACPKCGMLIDSDDVFCSGCGTRVEKLTDRADVQSYQVPPATAAGGAGAVPQAVIAPAVTVPPKVAFVVWILRLYGLYVPFFFALYYLRAGGYPIYEVYILPFLFGILGLIGAAKLKKGKRSGLLICIFCCFCIGVASVLSSLVQLELAMEIYASTGFIAFVMIFAFFLCFSKEVRGWVGK